MEATTDPIFSTPFLRLITRTNTIHLRETYNYARTDWRTVVRRASDIAELSLRDLSFFFLTRN